MVYAVVKMDGAGETPPETKRSEKNTRKKEKEQKLKI